jgi:HPr Serine kinase C-terminal domain
VNLEHSYLAFGLRIASALRFPELPEGDGSADVEIHLAAPLPPRVFERSTVIETLVAPNEWRLTYGDVGVMTVRDGRRIELAPVHDASRRTVRLALLGQGMAVLLHQRGFLVWHASAVEIGGQAVAFLGDSGSGKSTLAAALHTRGHRLVADDVVAVRIGPQGPEVYAGFPQLKLWPDALGALGLDAGALRRVEPGLEKRAHRIDGGFAERAVLPLAQVHIVDEGPTVELAPVRPHEAFLALVRFAYGIQRLEGVTGLEHFRARSEIVRRTPVYRLSRPWDLSVMHSVVDRVEGELESRV